MLISNFTILPLVEVSVTSGEGQGGSSGIKTPEIIPDQDVGYGEDRATKR
jgi:hypothetical protein